MFLSVGVRVAKGSKSATTKIPLSNSINPIALRKVKIAYNFGLSECNRVKVNG